MLVSYTLCLISCEGDPTSKCSGVCKALTSGVQYGGKDTQLFLLPTTPRERPRNTVPRSRITPLSEVKKRAFRSEEGRLLGIQRKRERGREGSSREHTFCPVSSALLSFQPRRSIPALFLSPMRCFLLHSMTRKEKGKMVARCVDGCGAVLRLCARVSLWVSGFLEGSERFVPSVHDQRVLPTGRKSDPVGLEERSLHCFESRTHSFSPRPGMSDAADQASQEPLSIQPAACQPGHQVPSQGPAEPHNHSQAVAGLSQPECPTKALSLTDSHKVCCKAKHHAVPVVLDLDPDLVHKHLSSCFVTSYLSQRAVGAALRQIVFSLITCLDNGKAFVCRKCNQPLSGGEANISRHIRACMNYSPYKAIWRTGIRGSRPLTPVFFGVQRSM